MKLNIFGALLIKTVVTDKKKKILICYGVEQGANMLRLQS